MTKKFATYRQRVDQLNSLSDSKISDGKFYDANSYRRMALKFESEWRQNHPSVCTSSEVEDTFLRIISERKPQLVVEYGANLSPKDVGSGFSMEKDKADPSLGRFSKWNLNTIGYKPEESLLGLECDGNISGITMPWIYFGMMFANFSTHVEDNHLFSINYMHQGSPKTWYGVRSVLKILKIISYTFMFQLHVRRTDISLTRKKSTLEHRYHPLRLRILTMFVRRFTARVEVCCVSSISSSLRIRF